MMRGDEGSLKGVEQKVHATEFVIRSYISLRVMGFLIHEAQCRPANMGGGVVRDEDSPFWSKSKGVLFPDDSAFGNVR